MSIAQAELFKKFSAKSKPRTSHKCATKYCRRWIKQTRKVKNGRVSYSWNKYCSTCSMRQLKERNPLAYRYGALKANARRRGKAFKLTLAEFTQFVTESGYIVGTGKTASSLSIDRIDSSKGYELGNLQVLTLSANSRKGARPPEPPDDEPF